MSNARRNYRKSCLLAAGTLFLAGPLAAQIQTSPLAGERGTAVIIAQTSSGGSNTYLIDPLSNEVIGIIEGLGLPHGITVNPEGTKYYVTNEHDISVDVVDTRTLQVIKRIPLAARPNNIASSSRARKVYAAISGAPMVQVIDMDTDEIVKSIPTVGRTQHVRHARRQIHRRGHGWSADAFADRYEHG